MLVARGKTELRQVVLKWAVGVSPRIWCLAVDRTGLVLDTRQVPAAAGPGEGRACLYVLLSGRLDLHGVGAFEGPSAFVLTMAQVEGARGARASTFRSTGDPYIALELRLADTDLVHAQDKGRSLALDANVWSAAWKTARLDLHDDDSYAAAAFELLDRLVDAHVVTPGLRDAVAEPDPWAIRRLWPTLKPMIESLAPASSLQDVSAGTGLSLRQLPRVLEEFLSLAAWGLGWRQITLHGRFKIAILFLSAEGVTIEEVARIVGYGSVNAMSRAFRLAGLDAPSLIQERLRDASRGVVDSTKPRLGV